jgi:uncharacterized membrane protein YeaQ/YmgE (transglycosylase-associated protein family)
MPDGQAFLGRHALAQRLLPVWKRAAARPGPRGKGPAHKEVPVINFILWLLFGALVGWLASLVMRTDAQQGALLNIVVGIVGAFLGGLLFNLLGIGGSNINDGNFSIGALIVSFVGAVVLLGIVNLFRRGTVR